MEEATETADKCEGMEPDDDVNVDKDETIVSDDEGQFLILFSLAVDENNNIFTGGEGFGVKTSLRCS